MTVNEYKAFFQLGQFNLHSGRESQFKIDCDFLTEEDWETLAWLIAQQCKFSSVEAILEGGWFLSAALQKYKSDTGPLLIVDDVCTTGNSLETQRAGRDAIGFVVFSRGNLPSWCSAVFHMTPGFGD